jgi:hypothetical protein
MLKKIGAVVAGLAAAFVLVTVVELICSRIYPLPPGLPIADAVKTMPLGAFLILLGGWFIGTLAGSWTAAKIANSRVTGAIVGAVIFAAAILNMVMIPHPTWFMATAFAVFFIGAVAGTRLGAPPRAAATA